MKYKVGDKVKIREDLVVDMGRDGIRVTESMLKYAGKVVRIRKTFDLIGAYEIDADNKVYVWTDEMLEDVESGVMMIKIYQDGNKVIAKKDGKVGVARCSPDDKFDIFTGARLAIDRLEEKCKPYSWLKNGVKYYYPCVGMNDLYDCCTYATEPYHKRMISRGLVFKTKEEAIEAAKKMLAVVKEADSNDERRA